MKNKTLKILFIFITICIIYVCIIYFFQDKFLFEPETDYKSPQVVKTPEFIENPLIAKDKTKIMTWYFKGNEDKPLILFFHGNSGQLSKYSPMLTKFTKEGYSVAMLEYRSFGNTKGKLTQTNTFSDAIEFYDYYKNKSENKVIFYGYSFGCAVAIGLTKFRHPDGIILTAPFVSFYEEVKDKYYVPFAYYFLKDRYLSNEYIINLVSPIIFIHGKEDSRISYKHSKKLFDLAPTKEKQMYLLDDVNHHDIFFKCINFPIIQDWLKQFN